MEEEEVGKNPTEIEAEILRVMRARVGDFKEQADSLTLEGVRRALEKDLGLKAFALDVHKRFIKQCLEKCFFGANDENASTTSDENVEKVAQPGEEEKTEQFGGVQPSEELGDASCERDEEIEGSPALVGQESEHETEKSQSNECNSDLSEDTIKKAIKKRAAYFRANSEEISPVGVRRLLEEDLRLEKNTLDSYKSFISEQLDEVFQSAEVIEPTNGLKRKRLKKASQGTDTNKKSKGSKKVSKDSDTSDSNEILSEDGEVDEEKKRPKKKVVRKVKASTNEALTKKKKSTEESKSSSYGRKKPAEPVSEKSTETEAGNSSEDDHSHSSAEEGVKEKREQPTQVYGKRVEHLKSIIKSCGMGIPPSVYKRAKQAPESKREASLIKELEEILGREGLSTNPSEKEIKAVRKRKERAKELEGIDMSNIVSSSRRRTTSNFISPPKPKIPVESDDEDEDNEDEDNENDEENTDDDNSDAGGSGEGSDEDVEDESD